MNRVTGTGTAEYEGGGGGQGGTCPQYFENYKDLARKSVLCPPPNIESLMVPPPPNLKVAPRSLWNPRNLSLFQSFLSTIAEQATIASEVYSVHGMSITGVQARASYSGR